MSIEKPTPRTMSAEREFEIRDYFDGGSWTAIAVVELEDYLRSEIAAHAETLNERDAARWERDRAISQLAETREQLEQARKDTERLKEAISPGRIGEIEYYVGVAKRMRDKETVIKPMTGEIQFCKRASGHSGPCNGYPREDCADSGALRAKQEGGQ